MNTLRKHIQALILLPLIFAAGFLARAQDSDSGQTPPPSPPYVGAVSGDFTLVKKFTYLGSDTPLTNAQKAAQDFLSPPSAKTNELDAIETGAIRKDKEIFLDGSSREIWRLQSYRFTVYAAHPNSIIMDIAVDPNNTEAVGRYKDAADFPELSWIQGPMFTGIQMQGDKKCYTYKQGEQTAWIDTATRLPVHFKSKSMEVTYTYSGPPDEPLQLPQSIGEKLQNYKRATGAH
jgi:hypothetical protein